MRAVIIPMLLILFTIGTSNAEPINLQSDDIKGNFDNFIVYSDSRNDKLAWVTPPNAGSLDVVQNSPAVTRNQCVAIAQRSRTLALASELVAILQEGINGTTKELIRVNSEYQGDDKAVKVEELNNTLKSYREQRLEAEKNEESSRKGLREINDRLEAAGSYTIIGNSGWSDVVKNVQTQNQSYTVQPVRTYNAQVYLGLSNEQLENLDTDLFISDVYVNAANALGSVTDKISLVVRPTIYFGCLIKFPDEMGGGGSPITLTMTINFEHNLVIKQTIEAKYNLREVYSLLKQTKTKKRFFSSKKYSKTIEDLVSTKTIDIKILDDGDLSAEREKAIKEEVAEFLLANAISEMRATAPNLGKAPKNGALVAAEEINQLCGTNIYCQGASTALTILESTFGSSKAEARLNQSMDVTREYKSEVGRTISIPGTIAYTL